MSNAFSTNPLGQIRFNDRFSLAWNSVFLIVGILFWGWSPMYLVFGFWVEAWFTYLFAIMKIQLLRDKRRATTREMVVFIFHYGFFMLGLSIFFLIVGGLVEERFPFIVKFVYLFTDDPRGGDLSSFRSDLFQVVVIILVSHMLDFFLDFLLRRRFEQIEIDELLPVIYRPLVLLFAVLGLGFSLAGMTVQPGRFGYVVIIAYLLCRWFRLPALKRFSLIKKPMDQDG